MSWKLYLDDLRTPKKKDYIIARSVKEAKDLIQKKGFPKHMSLDHDLGEGETGYDFVKWVAREYMKKPLPFFTFQVHSANPVGKENMEKFLENFIRFKIEQVEESFSLMKRELTESLSKELYHFTSSRKATSILEKDKFVLTKPFGLPGKEDKRELSFHPKGKIYYLSASRTKFGGYARYKLKLYQGIDYVNLVLDGEKLNQNYKGKSMSFFTREDKVKTLEARGKEDFMIQDETEDRLFSNKPFIKNASKYIKEVHTILYEKESPWLGPLKEITSKRNIPLYIHESIETFKILKKIK